MHCTSKVVKPLPPSPAGVRRVAVIGCAGAGKTTIALAVGEALGLPVVHLDRLAWDPGWRLVDPGVLAARELEVTGTEAWVIDGGYLRSPGWPARLARAEVIVLVEAPLALCLWRIVRRAVRPGPVRRRDLPEGCDERLSPAFVFWTITWAIRTRAARGPIEDRLVRVRGW